MKRKTITITSGIKESVKKQRVVDIKQVAGSVDYYGGATNFSKIAGKHYAYFGKRLAEENREGLRQARLEQEMLRAKRLSNTRKVATGIGLTWDNLKKGKCPACSRKMQLNKTETAFVCDLHPGKPFVISSEKMKHWREFGCAMGRTA